MKARNVIDYIEWIEHNMWVHSVCDSLDTAMAVYDTFQRSASAERGRYVAVAADGSEFDA